MDGKKMPNNTATEVTDDVSSSKECEEQNADLGEASQSNEKSREERRRRIPKVVGVEWYDSFKKFKNRYSETEGLHIIEVLNANWKTIHEIVEEYERQTGKPWNERVVLISDDQTPWMDTIRIQSDSIIQLLTMVLGPDFELDPHIPLSFTRPFQTLYYTHAQMKECYNVFKQDQCRHKGSGTTKPELQVDHDSKGIQRYDIAKTCSFTIERVDVMDIQSALKNLAVDTEMALTHLKCYLSFVEEHVMPIYEKTLKNTNRMIRFSDIPIIFRPGELICRRSARKIANVSSSDSQHSSELQLIWRIDEMKFDSAKNYSFEFDPVDDTDIDVCCYRVGFDGLSYGPITESFSVSAFRGLKDILNLPFYPLRFLDEAKDLKDELRSRGSKFLYVVKEKHLYHEGWTLAKEKREATLTRPEVQAQSSEYVEGDVIVDFAEACHVNPGYEVKLDYLQRDKEKAYVERDRLEVRHWSGGSQTILLGRLQEQKVSQEQYSSRAFVQRYNNLAFFKSLKYREEPLSMPSEDDEDIILLPRCVYVYVLRERKFVIVDIANLRPMLSQSNVFKDLKIDKNHKRMVKSLVTDHFSNRSGIEQYSLGLSQDLIRGKGSGLVVLLHGVPGVGKTATAEAVAYSNKKPLLSITCGDLGFTPSEVENALRKIFRLAHRWQCVLLLDEADIFLSRRETSDLQRNALVSVFLRVMEYYSGILFLTTNRVGTIDEAFKSRIHLSLYYEPLSLDQTLAIFDVNIRKLQAIEAEKQAQSAAADQKQRTLNINRQDIMRYARWYYQNKKPWNGRQIRNAFQLASSLARFDMESTSLDEWDDDERSALNPVLNHKQFKLVAAATEKFDDYLYQATAADDEEKALQDGIRADAYHPTGGHKEYTTYRTGALQSRHPPSNRRLTLRPDHPREELTPRSGRCHQPTLTRKTDRHHSSRRFDYETSLQHRPSTQKRNRQAPPPARPARSDQYSDRQRKPLAPSSLRDDSGYSGRGITPKTHDEETDEYNAIEGAEEFEHEYSDEQAYDYGGDSEQDVYDGGSGSESYQGKSEY